MDNAQDQIRQNFIRVSEKIERTALRVGRQHESVRLVVVTKAQPHAVVQAAIDAGAKILGENYPEETAEKLPFLRCAENQVELHMIGHLQSRKAKIVADHFDMLHSLDSLSLAQKIDRLCAERNRVLPVLVQFNVGDEQTKSGWQADRAEIWPDFYPEIEMLLALKHISIRGLMTMPPLYEDPEKSRPFFKRLKALQCELMRRFPEGNWQELSMGTSGDYLTAIEEGSTLVRVGTAIVGQRVYPHL